MQLAISTRWNTCRHGSGETMLEEIIRLGFDRVELGYDLTLDLVPGVLKFVREGAIRVESLHNFCPVPIGAPEGQPEIYLLASADPRIRESAVTHTLRTIAFAAETGARQVVIHAGYVDVRRHTRELIDLCRAGEQYSPRFEKAKMQLILQRDKHAGRFMDFLCSSVEAMLPALRESGVRLAFENLPSWEALPSEAESVALCERFGTETVCCWYDLGHGQVRQDLGFVGHRRWMEKLSPFVGGYHIHSVVHPLRDHVMPPEGRIDFPGLKDVIRKDVPLVLEPVPNAPAEAVRRAADFVAEAWGLEPGGPSTS